MPIVDLARTHPAVRLRILRPHEVVYTLVGPRTKVGINIPALLRGLSIRLVGDLPKSGIQMHGPQWYQHYYLERNLSQPVRFGVVFEENMAVSLEAVFSLPALVHVIFWRSKDAGAIKALCSLSTPKIVIIDDAETRSLVLAAGLSEALVANDFGALLVMIESEAVGMPQPEGFDREQRRAVNQKIAEDWRDAVLPSPQDLFHPLTTNRSQIRQMLGEYPGDFWNFKAESKLDLRPAAQAATFDAVVRAALAMVDPVFTAAKWRPRMPTAILAFPSLSPLLADLLKSNISGMKKAPALLKNFVAIRLAEQDTQTFRFSPDVKDDSTQGLAAAAEMAMNELRAYTWFFDDMGYLHGSFQASPYLRAPLKGKSLSQHHSFFSPRNFALKARERAISRKIRLFSTALTKAIDPRMLEVLLEYPEAILGLSDLPVEWLDNDGVPLCFSHDVCRIPETTPTNMLSQFVRNQHTSFEIDESVSANTLIVCGAPVGDPVEVAFSYFRKTWTDRKASWKWAHCSSLDELYAVVNKEKPQLLIFDTHGRFTGNTAGTELQFGKEYLDGFKVIEHFPEVPLVIISSCWGAPLYGCANTIAHAFFEAGSFAVTCSLLPLDVLKGANLYSRVLSNLQHASEVAIHPTWASFMSHNVRTSYFDDLKIRMLGRHPDGLAASADYVARRTQWQMDTMFCDTRKKAFLDAPQAVISCFKPEFADRVRKSLKEEEFVPEFMFYSTMGRADLVQFSNWNAKNARPRDREQTYGEVLAEQMGTGAG